MSLKVVVNVKVRPDRLSDFLALAASHRARSLHEDGCLSFEVVRDALDPLGFALIEEYRDREALKDHQGTQHYAIWRDEIPSIQAELRTHREYVVATPPRVVFANGVFDHLHAGHVRLLTEAKAQGDTLIVGLNSDASARRLKGSLRPVVPFADRKLILQQMRCVDSVIGFDTEEELVGMVRVIAPDVIVKGSDARGRWVPGSEYAGRVHFVERLPERSTTEILAAIRGK